MNKELINKLSKLNEIEKEQLMNKEFISDFAQRAPISKEQKYIIPVFTSSFFKNKDLFISKHNRFADYPTHTHTFLEMNYMLTGQAHEQIGQTKITLNKGDILILDAGTTHSIKALGKNDLLINFVFNNKLNFSFDRLKQLSQNADVQSKFLFSNNSSNYLIYRAHNTEGAIQEVANLIIDEYFNPKKFSNALMHSYLDSFLILLSRNTTLHSSTLVEKNISNLVLNMIRNISENYQTISLTKIAQKYNYNRSYLGVLFKKQTGTSFSDALTDQRLLMANNLLINSSLPVSQIIYKVGISNKTFFYKKFKQKFGKTPEQVRESY